MNSNLQAIIRTAHISMVRAMGGDQDALATTRSNLSLALGIASDDEVERNAQQFARVAASDIDDGRLATAFMFLKRAYHLLE